MPERKCEGCKNQVMWGCFAESTGALDENGRGKWSNPALIPLVIDDEEIWRCPRRPIKDEPAYWSRLLFAYGFYKKGILPDAGALTDQSNKAVMLFGVIDDISQECVDVKIERERDKGSRTPPPGRR